jgi:hypothetical protein
MSYALYPVVLALVWHYAAFIFALPWKRGPQAKPVPRATVGVLPRFSGVANCVPNSFGNCTQLSSQALSDLVVACDGASGTSGSITLIRFYLVVLQDERWLGGRIVVLRMFLSPGDIVHGRGSFLLNIHGHCMAYICEQKILVDPSPRVKAKNVHTVCGLASAFGMRTDQLIPFVLQLVDP